VADARGDRGVWRLVRVPAPEQEEARRLHRERRRLVRERVAHTPGRATARRQRPQGGRRHESGRPRGRGDRDHRGEEGYNNRHLVEQLRARLKEWRAVATRYENTAASLLGVLCLAVTADWIKP
jgi:transposase